MDSFLLVGGKFDGQRMDVEPIENRPPLELETVEGIYKRVVVNFSGEQLIFYAYEDLSSIEAINMLLAVYEDNSQ